MEHTVQAEEILNENCCKVMITQYFGDFPNTWASLTRPEKRHLFQAQEEKKHQAANRLQ